MKLEAVIVSVDYADMLAETLPLNKAIFDRIVVVTSPEDLDTQRICRYHDVPHIQTDLFRARWGEFHKARGINRGLHILDMDGWVVHMDADIVLPPTTRRLIERADLHKWMLYGADRFQVQGHDAWRAHQALPPLQQDNYHVVLDAFPIAPRFSGERMGGYAPPGYFQLWHPSTAKVWRYPEEHNGAQKTDVLFTAKWSRSNRQLLAELVVYHLEPEPAAQGTNWGGRVTKRWGAEPVDRHRPHRHHHHHHHHHRWPYDCDDDDD